MVPSRGGSARRLGITVIEIDGSEEASAVARIVVEHFRAFGDRAIVTGDRLCCLH